MTSSMTASFVRPFVSEKNLKVLSRVLLVLSVMGLTVFDDYHIVACSFTRAVASVLSRGE